MRAARSFIPTQMPCPAAFGNNLRPDANAIVTNKQSKARPIIGDDCIDRIRRRMPDGIADGFLSGAENFVARNRQERAACLRS